MSHSYIADCSNSGGKGDDTLIIIVNSDGTLSVDPETLQKLLANQHQNSPISLVRLDSKTESNLDDDGVCDEDDDVDSRVNLTVEGYYPPAPSSPTPPPTPVSETNVAVDGGEPDVLADSITEILQPEDVEKLETVLQSVHAKEILEDVVLDMLQKNGDEAIEEPVMTQQGSVVLDHCYASLSGPVPPPDSVQPTVVTPLSPQSIRGTGRGRGTKAGRGRGSIVQSKFTVLPGATMVPVVEQLVMPGSPGTVTVRMPSNVAAKGQATVALKRVDLQQVLPANVMPCKVMLNKVPVKSKPTAIPPVPSGAGDNAAEWKPPEVDVPPRKKVGGRGRGVTTRGGRGFAGAARGRGQGRGRGTPKLSEEEEAQNKRLAEEMAATVHALSLAEADQLAQIESMDQSGDRDRVIPLVNKVPPKKAVKVYRRHLELAPKTIKVLKPEKSKVPCESVSSSHEEKIAPEPSKKEEKVIVVSMEPQITPAVVSAVVLSEGHHSQIPHTTVSAPTPSHRKNYPKRENRKPPAHLAEAFGPALFSTPDIIRRVSTDKAPSTPSTPAPVPITSPPQITLPQTVTTTITSAMIPPDAQLSETAALEEELGLSDNLEAKDQDSLMATISNQVTKQEDQLLEEALMLEDLPADAVLQDEVPSPSLQPIQSTTPSTVKIQQQKNKKQTSLSSFFRVVDQTKTEPKKETVVESSTPVVEQLTQIPGVRKLPPIELPATRGATKRAILQKEPAQDNTVKKQEAVKKLSNSAEKRKSTDSKKSTESRKSSGSFRGHSEDQLLSDEASDQEGSYNSEDDPNRLWCTCKRPHNNRFMICCDFCEDWFHGKCVGITKAMGEQMEENEIEWMCPNCKKKKKQDESTKKQPETKGNFGPSLAKEKKEVSKVMVQQQKLVVLSQDTPKTAKGPEIRITKVAQRKSTDEVKRSVEDKKEFATQDPTESNPHVLEQTSNVSGEECIVCKKDALAGGVYCSDECIAKHTSESLAMIDKNAVIVFEKKTGRIYGGANAPTPATLTSWLMAHPSYQVMRPGVLPSSKFYNQTRSQPQSMLKQTVLQTRPQGIQLIAALPQPPPIEGPLKKNLGKSEVPLTPKSKPKPEKGQQQITSLLKVQPKPTDSCTETKSIVGKMLTTSQVTTKKLVKEQKKTPQTPVVKKTTPTAVKKPLKEEPKQEQKKEESRGKEAEEQTVRASVRKTLQEVLTTRLQETSDLKLSEEQIKKLTMQIEEELYALFKDTSAKYKAKYRSLMFNIKDKNNLTLFRKIADKSLSPVQLVRLSPEELASQELAQWREREARHQLEMIKKTELDAMQQAKTVVMKTHKGEQVVENELGIDAKVLETSVEIEPVTKSSVQSISDTEKPDVKMKADIKGKEDKHTKKEKKEDHKERRHSHKSSHHKEHDRSRSRHRSRHRSDGDEQHSRSKSKSRKDSHSESAEESNKFNEELYITTEERSRSKSRPLDRSRSRHRHEERSKSKPASERGRSKSRLRERSKSQIRDRSKSRPRERSKSRVRERSKSRPRERSKSRPRERSKSRPRERSKSRPRERSNSQPRKVSPNIEDTESTFVKEQISDQNSLESIHQNIVFNIQRPAIFDAEIKGIIQDVVVEEEIGSRDEQELLDQEPSSTVNINTPPFDTFDNEEEEVQKPPVWKGTLLMPDVAKFSTSIQEVSGICGDLACDLPETIDCVGRISPETAWDYIAKMKKSGTKQILVVRFSSDNEEDKMSYLSFYSYLSSRNRLGVVGNNSKMIKDFYILPLPSHSPVPQVLLPLDGPGFEDYRPHLLLGIIVRTRRKRLMTDKELPFVPKMAKKSSERSYTPPLPDEDSHTPTQAHHHPATESFTPPHSPKPPRIIKLKPRATKSSDSPTISDDFVLEDGDTPYTPEDADVDAPYSPGEDGSSSPGCSAELQRKVDQLNRMINDIEQKKQKIDSLSNITEMSSPPQETLIGSQDDEEELEEAYSPSGSISPPATDTSFLDRKSTKISLPSDLQDIIASLKKKPDEPKSMDLKSDPIVQAYRSTDERYSPEEEKEESGHVVEEKPASPISEESLSTQSSAKSLSAVVKVNRDPRQRPTQLSLSQLSDEEIMKKASEMGFMNPENPEPIPEKLKSRSGTDSQTSGEEAYDPFASEEDRSQTQAPLQPPTVPTFAFNTSQQTFSPDFPPPPRPPSFPPTTFTTTTHMYQAPLPPLPPSHIPYTNPQPPPPQTVYPPPPPPQPAPLPPPPPSESPDFSSSRKKSSKKSKKKSRDPRGHKEKKEKRRYSESPPPKDYDGGKFDKSRERDRYISKRREKRETWRRETYDKSPFTDKRRDSWEYEATSPVLTPPQIIPGPPAHSFGIPPRLPMRGGPMRGGRFQRGMRGGFRRGFERPPMRGGFHRGAFHQRGHHIGGAGPPPVPGPSRNFAPKNIHSEFEEDIRRFEEQRLKQKSLERKRWRKESSPPKKRRGKDDDSD